MLLERINNLSIYFCGKPEGIDAELFVKKFFEEKGYVVTKKNTPSGIPDFFCEKKQEKFYVEVKSKNDSLRMSQIRWIKENYDKPVIIFVTDEEVPKKIEKKLKLKSHYICSRCGILFNKDDISEEDEEKFCYPCLRKYLFIKHYEHKHNKISNKTKKRLYNLKRELCNEDFFNREGVGIIT